MEESYFMDLARACVKVHSVEGRGFTVAVYSGDEELGKRFVSIVERYSSEDVKAVFVGRDLLQVSRREYGFGLDYYLERGVFPELVDTHVGGGNNSVGICGVLITPLVVV